MLNEQAFAGSSICVVGNINRDVKTAPLPAGDYLLHDGETPAASVSETIGGGGANSAFTAASLGARVAFLGKVGADGLGERLNRTLTRHGIDAHLARDESHPSGSSLALTFEDGHRHFVSCLPASRALGFDDLNLQALTAHEHLLRADIWFSESMLFGGNKLLFQTARQAGLAVSIDLNWDPHWGRADPGEVRSRKQAVRNTLPWVNLVHGNVRELTEFAGAADLEGALKSLLEWGAEAVVVHLGEKGAGYYSKSSFEIEPPAPVKSPQYSVGTGDVLSVCMMLLHRRAEVPVAERLRLANFIVSEFMSGERQFIPHLED